MFDYLMLALATGYCIGRFASRPGAASKTSREKLPDTIVSPAQELEIAKSSLDYAKRSNYWIDKDRQIVNDQEREILRVLRSAIDQRHNIGSFPIYCQIPFSAYVKFKRKNRLSREIASRRQDFTIVSHSGRPIMLIEYQGVGHGRRGPELTEINDEIKRTVANRLGLKLIEIQANEPAESYVSRVLQELDRFRKLGAYQYAEEIMGEDYSVETKASAAVIPQ